MNQKLLTNVLSPADLRRLPQEQLPELAEESRHLIKTTVSQNGGHLASNLGIVELTIALNYVFSFNHDRVVWDVGHQCYVHKILTGRAEQFSRLRQKGGISGFPNPNESDYDQFSVGHAGTAIASAVGLALGAQLQHTDEKVVAVVGDASIVNGLSFEGLNNTSLLKRQLLIILNDNSMAIDKTQGAFAGYLTHLRLSRSYGDLQRRTKLLVKSLPYIGDAIHDTLDRLKGSLKTTLQVSQKFDQLGIPTYGSVDGHDISALIELFHILKEVDHPIILHVQTEKGRGFTPASTDPCMFHSPSPFTVDGETASFADSSGKSFTSAFSKVLAERMEKDRRIVAITAAMPDGTGLAKVRQQFPDRIIDVGIAESAAVDIAAGLAKKGMRPVVAIYSTFLQRSFDQIFQEVSLQNLPVIFCMDRAGMVGGDGAVHHGFCDITMLRSLPNLVLMAPMNESELDAALELALQTENAVAIRYPRDLVPDMQKVLSDYQCEPFTLGKPSLLRLGKDAIVLAYGTPAFDALAAAQNLEEEGIDLGVISARFAKPIDETWLLDFLGNQQNIPILTLEDHSLMGGFGASIVEFANEHKIDARNITRLGIPDRFIEYGSRKGQLAEIQIDAQGIEQAVRKIVKNKTAVPAKRITSKVS
jgi:1-deoxy-D-xylulose-5-phosphate synthase